jgi:hypothetical protein
MNMGLPIQGQLMDSTNSLTADIEIARINAEPRQKSWRAIGLCILWSVGAPVLLMLAVIALDAYSVHRTPAALDAYVQAYWEAMPGNAAEGAPDCYSRPSGDPVAVKVALGHPLALAVVPGRGWHVERD